MKNRIQEEPLFHPAPFFMVRIPLLPIEDFSSFMTEEELYSRFLNDQLVREAIMIASPTLYNSLLEKKTEQTTLSLFKYLNRMCSRATPFGLFSCISIGEWGETASTTLEIEQVYKRARPDMEWLSLVIDQLSEDPTFVPFLSVKRNGWLFEAGERVFLHYIREKKGKEKRKVASIRLSFLTKAIFELTQFPISIEDLKTQLLLRFPSLEKEKLQGVIQKLLEEQFLDFNLRPSLLSESPFKEFLSKITPLSSNSSFHTLATQIENYHQIAVGQGEKQLQDIQQLMRKIAISPHSIQVDTACAGKKVILPKIVINELQKSLEMLWQISCIEPLSSLQSYHEKFLNHYGTFRLVPLLELLTEERGLGIPENYMNPTSEKLFKNNPKRETWNAWLQKQWAICLREKSQEIEIDETIVREISEMPAKETALLSLDLRCEITAPTTEEIDKGSFLVQIEPFAWQGGATFGRFIDLLGEETKDKLQAFFREEEALDEDSLFVESSYHHMNFSRSSNVMIQPNLRNHSIDLGGKGTISLEEIYVGAHADRLYLTLKEGGKELRVTSSNMFNPTYAPFPLRFIRDVSSSKYRLLSPFSWGELSNAFFLPRVRYKKTIFFPAQWKVDLFHLTCSTKETIETIEKQFLQWADSWQLPRYLLMAKEDNRLLLDRHHPLHLREIAVEIKKKEKVHLIEKMGQIHQGQIQSQKGSHYAEFIIPFVKNKIYSIPSYVNKSPFIKYHPISVHSRTKLPGSDWLFIKYYLGAENENRFLIEQCQRYVRSFLEKKIIKGWFFVRYADPKTHLRLRFWVEKEQMLSQLISEIHEWAATLVQKQMINEMTISTYEREVERYGGEELIEPTEALFCGDTETSLLLVQALVEKKTRLPEEVVTALSMIDLLRKLGLNLKEQLSFFSSLTTEKEELSGFRTWKTPFLSICQTLFEDKIETTGDALLFNVAFQKRVPSLQAYKKSLREVEHKQKLTTSLYSLYDSILHMHYNRVIGRSGKEKKVRLYAYHILTLLQQKNKLYQPPVQDNF